MLAPSYFTSSPPRISFYLTSTSQLPSPTETSPTTTTALSVSTSPSQATAASLSRSPFLISQLQQFLDHTRPSNPCSFLESLLSLMPSLPPALLTQLRFCGHGLCCSLCTPSTASTHSPLFILSWQNPKPSSSWLSPYSMPAPEQLKLLKKNNPAEGSHFTPRHKPHMGPQRFLAAYHISQSTHFPRTISPVPLSSNLQHISSPSGTLS